MASENATNALIPTASSYRDVYDFLSKHGAIKNSATNKKIYTNTRIGDEKSNIHGGLYNIPDAEYPIFLQLFHRDIIKKDKKEYFTEKQRESDGPILVDIDFRHNYEVEERQYTKEHIDDLIDVYLDEFKLMFQLDETSQFPIFVMQKETVNRLHEEKKTKDGIHIIFGVQADRITQQILRENVIKKVKHMWADFPKTNSWEDVFDIAITKGTAPWQLYGCRKPNHDRYKLTYVYNVSYDTGDEQFQTPTIPLAKFDIEKNIEKLSVRYKQHLSLFMRSQFVTKYNDYKAQHHLGEDATSSRSNQLVIPQNRSKQERLDLMLEDLSKIRNKEDMDMVLNYFLDSITDTPADYELKTIYEYIMILPEKYYTSYDLWIRVGWVLRNIHKRLLIVWIAFSAKLPTFDYRSQIPDLCERWRNFDQRKGDGLTKLSLYYWAMTDAKEEYERVRRDTIDYYVENTINSYSASKEKRGDRTGCADFDLANVLYQLYKNEFVCVSVKANIWYQYKNNRWQEIDSGTTLRKSISVQLRELYNRKTQGLMNNITNDSTGPANSIADDGDDDSPSKNRTIRVLNICQRLSSTNDKKNIMTEAKELFYDGTFLGQLDTNPYLLCFNNGVIDFQTKEFRKGRPEDNISMCTGYDYVPLESPQHDKVMNDIHDFMNKLFPQKELCEYMWDHLASTLIGTSPNQTFNMYIGIGQNGKSVLVDLMTKVLGEYKGDVMLSLVTDKRGKVGGLAPEIVQLKGKRYAVMQEPSKGDVINEGVMKQLTSGKDPLQGRAPYMPQTITFMPQFKLVVTCNALMTVKANDHGTWRRIRAVPFNSLFTETPVEGDPDKPYQFKIDKYIDEKFDSWKSVFAAMLVKRVFETNGEVKDCEIVLARSNEYRQSQDYISEFVHDRLKRDPSGSVKKGDLAHEFSAWYNQNTGGRPPSPKDLYEYMDKQFGRQRNQMWKGVKINYDRDQDEEKAGDDDSDDHTDDGDSTIPSVSQRDLV